LTSVLLGRWSETIGAAANATDALTVRRRALVLGFAFVTDKHSNFLANAPIALDFVVLASLSALAEFEDFVRFVTFQKAQAVFHDEWREALARFHTRHR